MLYTHRWEDQGVGKAPFHVVGVIELPGPEMAEANPTAYQLALEEVSEAARRFNVSPGSCNVCGMGIKYNYVIEDADGRHFVVGSDCVRKTRDAKLVSDVEKLEHQRELEIRRIRAEEREARRRAEFEAEQERQRAETGGLTYHEIEQKKRAEEQTARAASIAERNGWLIEVLEQAHQGGFVQSILQELRETTLAHELPPRALAILSDIYAKTAGGRGGSKKYDAAMDEFADKLDAMKREQQ